MRFFIIIILCILSFSGYAQIETVEKFPYKGNSFNYFIINADSISASRLNFIQSDTLYYYDELMQKREFSQAFFINSCVTDSLCKPLGLFIEDGKVNYQINNNNGQGNFYLKPNGCLLVSENNIEIIETNKFVNLPYLKGIQSGPMLINNSIINTQFSINSNNKTKRSAVGEFYDRNQKKLIFCTSMTNVSFYEFSDFLLNKFKCKNALNLESGNAFIYFPGMDSSSFNNNTIICNFTFFDFTKK
jgi:uncharacterized protein YigE (DUF2233 family)